jgi:parvulin-like peptidyl-prolyl isomerase
MKKIFIFLFLISIFLFCGCSNKPDKKKDTIAIVGSFVITKDDLMNEIKHLNEDLKDDEILSELFNSLIERALILNKFLDRKEKERYLTLKEFGDLDKINETAQIVLEREVYSKINISSQEVENYYKEHIQNFTKGEGFLVRQMTIQGEKLKEEASKLIGQGYSFEEVAILYSISPDKGKLQYFEKSELPEYLLPILNNLKKGEVSKPIEISEDTYQIIRLESREKNYVLPIDMVRQIIRLELSDEKGEKLKEEFINSLKKQYNIKLFPQNLWFNYVKETR